MIWIIGIALFAIAIILAIYRAHQTRAYLHRGVVVNILGNSKNKEGAIAALAECDVRIIRLLDHLRRKYKINATDAECDGDCERRKKTTEYEIVRHLLRDFNYEAIREHKPNIGSKSVAYSLDKGKTIMLCLRNVNDPLRIIDINTLMFVILHEAAHVANYDEWGHETRFWSIFKYLLEEAQEIGVYRAVDYTRFPKDYCGFTLDHSPLFDSRIASIAR